MKCLGNTATYPEQAYHSFFKEYFQGDKLLKGDIILMLGYGWGFSASVCMLEFKK
jgi:hypothetical protein